MENKVLLKHLIEILRMTHEIELRDENNYRLFNCPSTSQALEPYLNREIIELMICDNKECSGNEKIVVLVGGEE